MLTHHAPWSCQWMENEQGWPRLRNPIAAILQPEITTATHSTPTVIQNQGLFDCLTTPAPDTSGRPPPARTNEKPDTMARWQADHRRLAPWQYQTKYLVTSCQGTTGLAPATMREQMMGFSGSHTTNMTNDPTEYHRNKALGNTSHFPTATWLLFVLLLNTLAQPATAVSYSPTQRATAIWLANPAPTASTVGGFWIVLCPFVCVFSSVGLFGLMRCLLACCAVSRLFGSLMILRLSWLVLFLFVFSLQVVLLLLLLLCWVIVLHAD